MAREHVQSNQGLEGTEPYGSHEGVSSVGSTISKVNTGPGIEPAWPTLNPVKTAMPTCVGLNLQQERCMAPRAKGTEHCIGHLRRIEKESKAQTL